MPVDPGTYARFLQAEERAKRLGLSLVEVLDRNQLLVTQKYKHDTEVQANEQLLQRLDRQSPNKLLAYYYGRPDGTAQEMFEAMRQWLELVVSRQANKTLEDL